jgi:CheY-like chemotaxis protein
MTRLEIESPGAIGHLQEPLSRPSEIKPEGSGGSSEFSNKAELEVRAHVSPKSGLKVRVLVVEDDPADVELVLRALRSGGFDPVSDVAQTEADVLDRIRKNSYDAVLADYNLPTWNGMEAVNLLRREGLDIPGRSGLRRPGRTQGRRVHQAGCRRLRAEGSLAAVAGIGAARVGRPKVER